MADKKITALTERLTAILGTDVLPLVGNTAGTPVNQKVQVKNFVGNLTIDIGSVTVSAMKVLGMIAANGTAVTLTGSEVGLLANSSAVFTTRDRIGLKVRNEIQNGTSNVTGLMTTAVFTLDTGNSQTNAASTFGVVIDHTLDANVASARLTAPRAYLAIKEKAGSGNTTLYLMDIGALGNTVSANTTANANVVYSRTSDMTCNRTLKISVNGEDVWLLASNSAPA